MRQSSPFFAQFLNSDQKLATFLALVVLITLAGCQGSIDEPGALVPPTVDEDPTLNAIDVRGTRLRYQTYGDPNSPPIIMLHGGPGGDYAYLERMEVLSDDYFVVLYDQRGTGLSRRHDPGTITLKDHFADLDAVADELLGADATFHLLGHSWGGQVASGYLDDHADRVDQLILLDPGPLTDERFDDMAIVDVDITARGVNDTFWQEASISFDGHARMDYLWLLGLSQTLTSYQMSTVDPMPAVRIGAQSWRDIMDQVERDGGFDFRAGPNGFTGDVLFIRGGRNLIHDEKYFDTAESDFAQATSVERVTIDAGHDQIWAASDDTAAAIRTFLGK